MTDPAERSRDRPGARPRRRRPGPRTPEPAAPARGTDAAAPTSAGAASSGQFAGELIQTAATVAGAAQALQRASAEAASAILEPGRPAAGRAGRPAAAPAADRRRRGFRTPFREDDGVLYLIDQRRLPDALVEYPCRSAGEVAYAIREMIVRGAPAIGQVAAIGLALTADADRGRASRTPGGRRSAARANALDQRPPDGGQPALGGRPDDGPLRGDRRPVRGRRRDRRRDARRGRRDRLRGDRPTTAGWPTFGLDVAADARRTGRVRILTHCNTGPLACGQFGTALGVVQAAHHAERPIHVWVDETRPYLQGARLTAWELAQAGVPHTLIPDVAAGHLMARGEVDVVLVGADRVAANGDTANKVGTYTLAVLAARHGIPFYVCAPTSSVDLATPDGAAIPIEERKRRARSSRSAACASRRPGTAGPQPGLRRHAGRADHRDRHRGGRRPGAVRGRPARRRRDAAQGALGRGPPATPPAPAAGAGPG